MDFELLLAQIGKFHPIVLHFPVVLAMLMPVVMIASVFTFGRIWKPTIPYFIHLGALSAIPASISGLLSFQAQGGGSAVLELHRNLALTASLIMIILSIYSFIRKIDWQKEVPKTLIAIAIINAMILMAAAHIGGESVHGDLIILFSKP